MSYDLAIWREPVDTGSRDAAEIYDALTDGETDVVGQSVEIRTFYTELTGRYPDLAAENMETSPWSSSLYVNSECVIASISWSRQEEVENVIRGIAGRLGLTVYDPQNQIIHSPS